MLIKHRIYLSLFFLSMLPLMLVAILTERVSEDALREVITQDFLTFSRVKSEAIGRQLDERISETRLLSKQPTIIAAVRAANLLYDGMPKERVIAGILNIDREWVEKKGMTPHGEAVASNKLSLFLKQIQANNPDVYGEIFLTDRYGANVAMTKVTTDYYQADEYWWQQVSGKEMKSRAYLDDRGFDESVGAIVIGVTVPVLDQGELIGVLKINYRVKAIIDIVSGEDLATGYETLLARSDGSVITSNQIEFSERLSDVEISKIKLDEPGVWKIILDNKNVIAANHPMKYNFRTRKTKGATVGIAGETTVVKTWHVIYRVEESIVFSSLDNLRHNTLITLLISITFVISIGYLLSRSINRPLAILRKGTQVIGSGDLSHRILLPAKDEFGALATAFNEMADRQRHTLASRDELNNEIAERKNIQLELSRFKSTLDNTMDCVFMFDPKTLLFFYVNDGAIEQVGYTYEEMLSMTPVDIKPEFDEARFREMSDALVEGPEHSIAFETLHRHKDGHDIPVEVFLQYIVPADTPPRFLAIVRDITDRLQTEEEKGRLQRYLVEILDSMPSIVVGIDNEGVVTHWNRQAMKVTELTPDEAIDSFVADVMPMLRGYMKEVLIAAARGRKLKLPRMTYHHKGERYHADVLVYPLKATGIEGAVIRLDDITDRVHMEEMMAQTEKMLSVGGLAGGMAHELNNPIGGMVQGVQNIRRRLSSDVEKNISAASHIGIRLDQMQEYFSEREIDKLLDSITQSGERASVIVNNMLRFTRKSEMNYQSVNMADLLDETIELAAVDYDLKKKFDFRSIEIERHYQSGLPMIHCIPGEIQQVVLNLLRNSAHAFGMQSDRSGTPRIILRTWKDEGQLHLEVADNGPGMDEQIQKRVFEPFFTTKPPGLGTGLGLSVSYYIIHEEHHGEISLESEPGKGARFTISIPYKEGG